MVAATHCYIPILGKRLRVTLLDQCGLPPVGGTPNAWLATDGFVTVKLSAQIESGKEILIHKADGTLCVNEKLSDTFKRFDMDVEFCGVNPSLLDFMTNANVYNDVNLDSAGFTIGEGPITTKFAFELWTGLSGAACGTGGNQPGGYLLLPFVSAGVIGDISVSGQDALTFSVKGAYTKGGNGWGVGPYKPVLNATSVPSALPTAISPFDHLLLIDTAVAPPPSACSPQVMPPVNASGATAGAPGTWTPFGSTAPATAAAATTAGIIASPATAWTSGQYVQGSTAGATGQMYWSGVAWVVGIKP